MALVNKSVAPYYDDYDSTKQYTHLLALPGRVAQAREITQIQSVVKDIVKSIGDSILKDGNVVEGCQVIVDIMNKKATITSGKVYLNGMVLPVTETRVDIKGTGTETIGFKLKETLYTEAEDNSLRDPAQGYDNFNQPGCHRIKSEVEVVVDDPEAAILSTLIDGAVSVERYAPEYDTLTQTLARRTYDESGSYLVEGLSVRVEEHATDDTKFNVVVESGKAYVLGYELKIPAPRRVEVPRATTVSSVTDVIFSYSQENDTYTLSSTPYVSRITLVTGTVKKTITSNIDNSGARTAIEESAGLQIVKIGQGTNVLYDLSASTNKAEKGIDWDLINDGGYYIQWKDTTNHPELGSEYYIEYYYIKTFDQGIDYELSHDLLDDSHDLKWISGGSAPEDGKDFRVNYEQYLARKDIVYIDQYGAIGVVQGIPARYGFEIVPDAPVNTLALAVIMSPPGGIVSTNTNLQITSSNIGLTRFTMNDIQKLLNRIRTIEYDQAVLSLNEEAKQYEGTTSAKKGIFTDPLINLSKIDYYYNLDEQRDPIVAELPNYKVTMDLQNHLCYLPNLVATVDAVYSDSSTSNKYSRIATLSKTGESVVLSQMNATKAFLINPYSVFPGLPEISISPAVDVWIDDTIITVPVSQETSEVISTSTNYVESSQVLSGYFRTYSTTSSTSTVTAIGNRVETSTTESVISEQAIKYIRPRIIKVEGSNFPDNLDNIKCYFDGVLVPLTPTGDTVLGTEEGSIKSSATGRLTAEFQIPNNVLTGIREVRLESSIKIDGYESSAFALYQASGTARTIQRTVTTLTTVLLNRVTTTTTTTYIDPVGQTFVLDRMTLISGIDLYFQNKPEGTIPVTCDIREVVNGTITSTVLGHKTLSALDVNVSSDSKVATRFTFEDPVLLEPNKEYAFVVRSTSDKYRIWVAELGENDLITGSPVLSNPYLIGVMMSSSNNSSWTNHQTMDIKFRLVEDTYSTRSEIIFDNIDLSEVAALDSFSRIYFLAETAEPTGTSLSWYYSLDNGNSYTSISPYNMQTLRSLNTSIKLKGVLTRADSTNLSPMVAIDSIGVVLSRYDAPGWYITKNISGLDSYSQVDIVLDTYTESAYTNNSHPGVEIYVYTGGSTGATSLSQLQKATLDTNNIRYLNYGWREQTYKLTLNSPATNCRIFIKLDSTQNYFTPAFRRLRVIMS